MKPVTSALHNWMSALFVHPLFRGVSFFHIPDGVGSCHYNRYSIGMTSVPDHINNRLKNLLTIQCYNTKSNHIEVRVEIEQPDAIFQTGEDNVGYYTNLKLKDIIEFVKMYKTNFESSWTRMMNPFVIYFVKPQEEVKDYISRNEADYLNYKNMVKTCFDFLNKREQLNIRMKSKESDF
jgi:hypothetical protein